MIDGAFPERVQDRLLAAIGAAMRRLDLSGIEPPQLRARQHRPDRPRARRRQPAALRPLPRRPARTRRARVAAFESAPAARTSAWGATVACPRRPASRTRRRGQGVRSRLLAVDRGHRRRFDCADDHPFGATRATIALLTRYNRVNCFDATDFGRTRKFDRIVSLSRCFTRSAGVCKRVARGDVAMAIIFRKRVTAGADDVEQRSSGALAPSSDDLELVTDGSNVQTVGLASSGSTSPKVPSSPRLHPVQDRRGEQRHRLAGDPGAGQRHGGRLQRPVRRFLAPDDGRLDRVDAAELDGGRGRRGRVTNT